MKLVEAHTDVKIPLDDSRNRSKIWYEAASEYKILNEVHFVGFVCLF